MMDIEEFTAIINPPDSAIMAVGRIKEIVVKKGEGFGVSNVMKITSAAITGALTVLWALPSCKHLKSTWRTR
jgi:pyruvate/2-oxoglutarate dehydrogenase complex dihydrolipoamide acyltransferase (E2) component